MSLFWILVTAFFLQLPQAASIEGMVVEIGTARPIARAVVQVIGDKSEPYTIETGSDGRFEFANLPRGQYQIRVSRTGYMEGAFGQRGPNGSGRSLPIEPGQVAKDIRITMVPFGAISGRVYDDRGEPVANVNVQALKYSYNEGQVSLKAVKSALTNDRGEYRLFWLPPGEYYVNAIPSTPKVAAMLDAVLAQGSTVPVTIERLTVPKQVETYAPVYYPGTPDARIATPVQLRPGVDLAAIDFSLVRVTPRKVRGIVVDPTGQPVKTASVLLVPRTSITGLIPARPASDGTFEIQDAFPGSYLLLAMSNAAGAGSRPAGGRVPIEIVRSDLDGISVVLSPSVDLPVTVEGLPGGLSADSFPSIALKNEVTFPGRAATASASIRGVREPAIESVIEGDYHLQITNLPVGTYVKSARLGAVEALNETLHVNSRTTDRLTIVFGSDGGQLDGRVVDQRKTVAANSSVVLIPLNTPHERPDLYKKTSADESGRFQLRDIAPGEYVIFAWEDVDESLWRDPEFVRRNDATGRRIHISANSKDTLELTAISSM